MSSDRAPAPSVLVTAVLPHPHLGGVHQRAWEWVLELTADGDLEVLLLGGYDGDVSPLVAAPRVRVRDVPGAASLTTRARRRAGLLLPPLALAGSFRFRAWRCADPHTLGPVPPVVRRIVAFRLECSEVARTLAARTLAGSTELDLDDDEATAFRSIGLSYLRRRRWRRAALSLSQAAQARLVQRWASGGFDVAHLASRGDASSARTRLAGRVEHRPNRVPDRPRTPVPSGGDVMELVFVGSLQYEPNVAAVLWLCDRLMPALAAAGAPARLTIIGRSPEAWLVDRVAGSPATTLRADASPEELAAAYDRATAVLAPLVSGSGTKLKVLEAIAHGRPVVATPHAVRDLGLVDGGDVALFQGVDAAVARLLRLRSRPVEAQAMADRARSTVAAYLR